MLGGQLMSLDEEAGLLTSLCRPGAKLRFPKMMNIFEYSLLDEVGRRYSNLDSRLTLLHNESTSQETRPFEETVSERPGYMYIEE